jgi:hypothetical protein
VYLADALAILSNVLADNPKVAGNPEALHAAIIKRGNWSAFSGRLVVKPTGDVDYPIGVYRFENGLAVRLSNLN